MNRILLLIIFIASLFYSTIIFAGWNQKPEVSLYGFVDIFYVYDFNQPQTESRQPFFYNHNRHNEFNLNLGLISLQLEHLKYRARLIS